MFQHFGQRLKRDLKQLVDQRLDASVLASGSHQRVRVLLVRCVRPRAETRLEVFRCRSRCDQPQTPTICRLVRRVPHGFSGASISPLRSRPCYDLLGIRSPSPSSTASVTRRRSTTRSGPASADVIKSSEVRRRLSDEGAFYSYTYHTGRNESLAVQEIPR